jgi:hypothetical protein
MEYGLKGQNLTNFQNNTWDVTIFARLLIEQSLKLIGRMQHEGNFGRAFIKDKYRKEKQLKRSDS